MYVLKSYLRKISMFAICTIVYMSISYTMYSKKTFTCFKKACKQTATPNISKNYNADVGKVDMFSVSHRKNLAAMTALVDSKQHFSFQRRTTGKKIIISELQSLQDLNCSMPVNVINATMSYLKKCNTNTRFMTLSSANGRTGNQMFQIAALLGIAKRLGYTPVINTSYPLARWFKLPYLLEMKLLNVRSLSVEAWAKYSTAVECLNPSFNWTLQGYFQSWKYFEGFEDDIRSAFVLKDEYMNEAKTFVDNITKTGHLNVCVHVRRGDMAAETAEQVGYSVPSPEFIYRAMRFYRQKLGSPQFIVLSDAIDWCKEIIKEADVVFSPFYETPKDMALMFLCDHTIVTAGSFGWWGAWISRGITVYYSKFPRTGSLLASNFKTDDYYPRHWIGML